MRVVVVGFGVQGRKRASVAGADLVAVVDPALADADARSIDAIDPSRYDAVLLCVPDAAKSELLTSLLGKGKHVLVEKPLILESESKYREVEALAAQTGTVCYVAYNHRFEPHFVRMRDVLASNVLGRIYKCRMFYGNGTARDVRSSAWRDSGTGVLHDLGSHLLDTIDFWFGHLDHQFRVVSARRYENKSFDHVLALGDGLPDLELEMTLLSWRNHFQCDVFAEHGSVHIESLCKWGPSVFRHRIRQLPSGRPEETAMTLVQTDPTWASEYAHFKILCGMGRTDLGKDRRVGACLAALGAQALAPST